MIDTTIGRDVLYAATLLRQNELVAIPTETVYGLAANALEVQAVEKIFAAKKRPKNNPLIIHLSNAQHITYYAQDIPDVCYELLSIFSPGPLTVLLNKKSCIPDIVTNGQQRVAVRIPNHDLCLQLLRELDFPLAAPSANMYTRISPTSAAHVYEQLGGVIPYILDGGVANRGIESTIVGFENDDVVLYRQGSISVEQIEQAIGKAVKHYSKKANVATVTSGMSKLHYAPQTSVVAFTSYEELVKKAIFNKSCAIIVPYMQPEFAAMEHIYVLSETGDLDEAASKFYDMLHTVDKMNFSVICLQYFPSVGIGNAVNDKIFRAIH